jgi:hypothetical protein
MEAMEAIAEEASRQLVVLKRPHNHMMELEDLELAVETLRPPR